MDDHIVQPNHGCALGAIYWSVGARVGKGDKIKKNFHCVPQILLYWVLNPCRGTTLPTRVWAISDTPLHRGGIDIWSNLVFIHYWVLVKQLSVLRIDTWGENPFFHPPLVQAKFP